MGGDRRSCEERRVREERRGCEDRRIEVVVEERFGEDMDIVATAHGKRNVTKRESFWALG